LDGLFVLDLETNSRKTLAPSSIRRIAAIVPYSVAAELSVVVTKLVSVLTTIGGVEVVVSVA